MREIIDKIREKLREIYQLYRQEMKTAEEHRERKAQERVTYYK